MATIKIKVFVSTNRLGSEIEDEIQLSVPDNFTEKQIEDAKDKVTKDWMFEQIEFCWSDV